MHRATQPPASQGPIAGRVAKHSSELFADAGRGPPSRYALSNGITETEILADARPVPVRSGLAQRHPTSFPPPSYLTPLPSLHLFILSSTPGPPSLFSHRKMMISVPFFTTCPLSSPPSRPRLSANQTHRSRRPGCNLQTSYENCGPPLTSASACRSLPRTRLRRHTPAYAVAVSVSRRPGPVIDIVCCRWLCRSC